MLRPRIIPCLLLQNNGLVKTVNFSDPKYVGDPINAVRIFNEKESDELIVIDIDATVCEREPNYELIKKLAAECRMPLCYGGGIKTVQQASKIIDLGVEKVALSSQAIVEPSLVNQIADRIGSQSTVCIVDVKVNRKLFTEKYSVVTHNAKLNHKLDPIELAKKLERAGAGEIVFNFVDLDGSMKGYDTKFALQAKQSLNIPITILGGASSLNNIKELFDTCGIIGAAAGSLFVFKGKFRAVLINYPNELQKDSIFDSFQS